MHLNFQSFPPHLHAIHDIVALRRRRSSADNIIIAAEGEKQSLSFPVKRSSFNDNFNYDFCLTFHFKIRFGIQFHDTSENVAAAVCRLQLWMKRVVQRRDKSFVNECVCNLNFSKRSSRKFIMKSTTLFLFQREHTSFDVCDKVSCFQVSCNDEQEGKKSENAIG